MKEPDSLPRNRFLNTMIYTIHDNRNKSLCK